MAIWRTHVWKSLWFAVRRSGKDQRARGVVLSIIISILVAGAYVWRFLSLFGYGDAVPHDGWAMATYAFLFAGGGIAFLVIRRARQRDDSAKLSLGLETVPAVPAHDGAGPREHVTVRLIIVASLVMRAASERYLRNNTIPDGAEVVTRQIHNRVLRERGAWESLEPEERDLLFVADGAWAEGQVDQIVTWIEQLRLLRWVLRIDPEIAPLAHFPSLDAALADDVIEREALPIAPMLGPWDIRPERDTALAYAARSLAELHARGVAETDDTAWAGEVQASFAGDSTDLLVEARTVADLNDNELRLLAAMACARERYAAWLVEQLGRETVVPFPTWSALQK